MVRAATVMYAFTPLKTRPAANITATGQTHSRYSWGPRVTPTLKLTSPAAAAALHRASEMRERVGLHSGAREVRATTYSARPTSAMELQPQKTVLVWIGRTRPKESHGTASTSGQLSFSASRSPAAVPTSSQKVAHARYSKATRTVAGSAMAEGRMVGSCTRRRAMPLPSRSRTVTIGLTGLPRPSRAGHSSRSSRAASRRADRRRPDSTPAEGQTTGDSSTLAKYTGLWHERTL